MVLPISRTGFERSRIYYKDIYYNNKNISEYFKDSFGSTSFSNEDQHLVLRLASPKEIFLLDHLFLKKIKDDNIPVVYNNNYSNNEIFINKILYINSKKEIVVFDYIKSIIVDIIFNNVMEK